ncbi:MAG: lactate utilization protein B [Thermodesulfobacteriota bacterium]
MAEKSDFNQIISQALNNRFLQTALTRATGTFKGNRVRATAEIPDFENLRLQARAAKARVFDRLDHYLVKLEERVTALGGRVFWAEDEKAVMDYIIALAEARGVKQVVKGKSMTTEEIRLNPALEAAGLEVFETDLGEYIIQLVGERPSHIIGPAIHKTKEEIARLFEKRLGLKYTDDPEEMTQAVRRELRTRFFQAGMGITGVNFAVAETGTLVIYENEGNIRMSTTLPRIHVAVMGLEKVVADLDDLSALMRILPLSATGQRLSSYVSFLTGPGRNRGEGPEELHLILYDGYRTQALADGHFRQILRCLRCGACLNFCPVYRLLGGHSYPWVYSGPVGVVLTGLAHGPEAVRDVAGASTLCRSCNQVCPVMIDLAGLILELRRRLADGDPKGQWLADMAGRCLATPLGFDLAGRCLGLAAGASLDPEGQVRRGPDQLRRIGQGRCLPRPSPEPFHRSLFRGDEE